MTTNARNDLERELTTPPLLKDQLLNVLKAGFENLGDAENAKLIRCLRQIQLARVNGIIGSGRRGIGKEEQELYDNMTKLCDDATKLPMGGGETAITQAWVRADNTSRRILYPAMVDLAERFGWGFRA